MLAGDVLLLASDGFVSRRHVAGVVAAVRPRREGGVVLGIERGFALEGADGVLTRLEQLWTDEGVRMNEGACDPDGRFYCGSMAYDKRPGAGKLYRLDPDGSIRVVLEGVTISNGLDWSPDGSLAYYNDTDTFGVDVFDYDGETGLSGRRRFVELGEARPDGLTVDAGVASGLRCRTAAPCGATRPRVTSTPSSSYPSRRSRRARSGAGPRSAVHHHLAGRRRTGRGATRRLAVPGRGRCRGPAGARVRGLTPCADRPGSGSIDPERRSPRTADVAMECSHLDSVRVIELPEPLEGCEECLRTGDSWVHLRMCLACGKVGCCDNSPNRHATAHFHETGHPLIRSAEPGEDWGWCYEDELTLLLQPS